MARERRVIRFSGSVQGVGFRYTACRAAAEYQIGGTVRNLPDGDVECVIEGERAEIDAFLADLREQMSGYIGNEMQEVLDYTGRYSGFRVVF